MRIPTSSGALCLAVLALAGPACKRTEAAAPRGTQITLLYSSNVHGEYEPCG
jgi:hypothetical protein